MEPQEEVEAWIAGIEIAIEIFHDQIKDIIRQPNVDRIELEEVEQKKAKIIELTIEVNTLKKVLEIL